MLEKPRRKTNRKYLAWIRSLPSVASGRTPCEAAHLRSVGAFGDDEGNVVPLTHHEHIYQLHQWGQSKFEQRWAVDLRAIADELLAEWRTGGRDEARD